MTQVTPQEIAQFRTQLTDNATAMKALDAIEDCDGDLEDAAISLAIRAGQQPQRENSEWLDSLARKCRAVICQAEFREDLQADSIARAVEYLAQTPLLPEILATPVLMYVLRQGIDNFCEPLDSQLL
jgi:hypothetical protein